MYATLLWLPGGFAHAGDPPKIKEGLWEVRGESVVKPGDAKTEIHYRLCRDHAYDKAANALLRNVKGCNTQVKDLGDGKFSSASRCNVDGTTIASAGLTTYKGKVSLHSDTQSTFMPAYAGKTAETLTQDQRYVGPCPRGMKVGDTLGVDGLLRHHD